MVQSRPMDETLHTADGLDLQLHHWPAPTTVQGRVLIVHGPG